MENHYILYLKLDMEDKEVHPARTWTWRCFGKDTIFAELIEEAKRAASDGGTMSRFSLTVKLLQAKSYYRISNVAFNAILLILALQYPNSSIPKSYEEALSIVGRLGLGYESIHVCPNNCVLFLRIMPRRIIAPSAKPPDGKMLMVGERSRREGAKALPIDSKAAKNVSFKGAIKGSTVAQTERQDVENDLSHPADGDAWKDFDNIHKDFAADARNIRLGLATDGFNPYGNMSNSYAWRATAGYQACVRCDKENCSKKLRNKICFIGHRRWLPRHHPWRNSKEFDGASESREKPAEFTPEELKQQLDRVRDVIPGKLQKKRKREDGQCWSRRSCLWDLPYWEDLKLRHNLDVMHIEKNICDNLLGTFMNIQGKTKDTFVEFKA
ncbi:uncharacterized protein [Lolium perenne]|uniref:uncharacterized protein n=1 Tax=Lolium perenne TaxID=4522 RepID=UPI003A9A65BE